tara:strand:+ start:2163 stop:4352 length:2190 start_codon:yes stop_codon:yes gene_type:complete
MTDATLTFNFYDAIGAAYDARRTKFWVEFNTAEKWVIDSDGAVRMGAGEATVTDAGLVTIPGIPIPSGTSNPTDFQVRVRYDAPARAPFQRNVKRETGTFGWFTIAATTTLDALVEQQYVPPTYLSTVTAQLDAKVTEAETAAAGAVTARTGAEAARDEAVGLITSDLGTTDGQTRALIDDPNSQTSSALSASIDARAARKYAVTINVRDYGAKGNRVDDDYPAILAAIDAANALPVNPLTGTDTARLVFPDGDYLISQGVVFLENVVPHMEGSARFVYAGSGTAVTFYRWANNSMAYQGDIRISVDRTTPTWATTDTSSVGVLFDTCWRMRVNVGNVRNFHTGIRLHGNGSVGWGGTSYIDLMLGYLLNNKIGIDATVENAGYVTAINTHGGAITLRDTGQTARVNIFTDPSVTGTAALAQYNGVGGAATFTAPTSGGWRGLSFGRLTWSTPPSSSGGFKTGTKIAATPGTSYVTSAYIRPSVALSLAASRQWYSSGTPTTATTGATVSCPANVWTRVPLALTCPTGSNEFEQRWYIVGAGITAANQTLDIDGVLIETGGAVLDYFDGGSVGGSWNGAANASTSTLSINAGTRYIRGPLAWCSLFGTMFEGSTVEKAVSITEDYNQFFGCSFEAVVAGGVEMSGLTGNFFFGCMGLTAFGSTLVDTNGSCTVVGSDGASHVGKVAAADGLGVGNSVAATTPGTVVKKMQIFDAAGVSLGYVPIYDAIT